MRWETNWKLTSIGSFPVLNQFCVIIGGRAIQLLLLSFGSITVNYKNLTYICFWRNVIFKIEKSSGPKGKIFLYLRNYQWIFNLDRLYKLDIKIIRIFLYYLLELTKMKTKLYPFPQNYNNDDGKPNFKHLYLGFHK